MAMNWYGDEVQAKVKNHMATRLQYAARQVRDHIRVRLGDKRGPTKGLMRKIRSGKAPAFAVQASAPGEFPAMRTGHLRRNIQADFDAARMVARVGTTVAYGKWLEFGTRKMAARPWLSLGLKETADTIRQTMGQEIRE